MNDTNQNSHYKTLGIIVLIVLLGTGLAGGKRLLNHQQQLDTQMAAINLKMNTIASQFEQMSQNTQAAMVTAAQSSNQSNPPVDKDVDKNGVEDDTLSAQLTAITESIEGIKTQVTGLENIVYANNDEIAVLEASQDNAQQGSDGTSIRNQLGSPTEDVFVQHESSFMASEHQPAWSSGTEQALTQAHTAFSEAMPDNNSNVIQNECRTGVCKVVVTHTDVMEADRYQKNMMLSVNEALPTFSMNTQSDNGVITNTYYFYASNEARQNGSGGSTQ